MSHTHTHTHSYYFLLLLGMKDGNCKIKLTFISLALLNFLGITFVQDTIGYNNFRSCWCFRSHKGGFFKEERLLHEGFKMTAKSCIIE